MGSGCDENRGNVTDRRDFKRRVRDRQARTGESYLEARRHVAAAVQVRGAMAVVEMTDISDIATQLGFACKVSAQNEILALVPAQSLLRRLQAVLLLPEADDLEAMRSVVFRAEIAPLAEDDEVRSVTKLWAFLARARAGVAGTFGSGRIIVLHDEQPLLFVSWPMVQLAIAKMTPRLVVMTLDTFWLQRQVPRPT
jgi:hypothetical protein